LNESSHLHGGARNLTLANRFERLCESRDRKERKRQGCQRHDSIEGVRKTTPYANSNAVRRSGLGVVKRQIHRSPGPERKVAGQGRGASLEEMPGAHEARVLVSKVREKQKSVVGIVFVLRGKPQGEP